MPDVPGMTGIAVVPLAGTNSSTTATSVNVWIARSYLRVTNVSLRSKGLATSQPGRATGPVMTTTTMLVALGTEEIVADPITTIGAINASASTVRMHPYRMSVHLTSKVIASPQISKETTFVTTETTTPAVLGM